MDHEQEMIICATNLPCCMTKAIMDDRSTSVVIKPLRAADNMGGGYNKYGHCLIKLVYAGSKAVVYM